MKKNNYIRNIIENISKFSEYEVKDFLLKILSGMYKSELKNLQMHNRRILFKIIINNYILIGPYSLFNILRYLTIKIGVFDLKFFKYYKNYLEKSDTDVIIKIIDIFFNQFLNIGGSLMSINFSILNKEISDNIENNFHLSILNECYIHSQNFFIRNLIIFCNLSPYSNNKKSLILILKVNPDYALNYFVPNVKGLDNFKSLI